MTTTSYLRHPLRSLFASLAFLGTLALISCSKDSPASSVSDVATSTTTPGGVHQDSIALPIDLDLRIDLANQPKLRALSATVTHTLNALGQHGITLPASFPVIGIIRSGGSDPVTYEVHLTAQQIAGTDRYRVTKKHVWLASGSTATAGKKWYLMLGAGGTFDPTAKSVAVDASADEVVDGTQELTDGGRSGLEIPMASNWLAVPVRADGMPKKEKEWAVADRTSQRVAMKPLGVLFRATLRLDDNYKTLVSPATPTSIQIKELQVVSTSLSFKGAFDLLPANLPALTATGAPQLGWTPALSPQPQAQKLYMSTDSLLHEHKKVFRAGSGANDAVLTAQGVQSDPIFEANALPNASAGKALPQGVQALIFWAMPVPGLTATQMRTTLLAKTGTSSNAKIQSPCLTDIYGKKHSTQVASERSVYLDAVYYHPYTPLDYMAECNVARKDPQEFHVGGTIPTGYSGKFATNHGVEAMTAGGNLSGVGHLYSITKDGRTYSSYLSSHWRSVFNTGYWANDAVTLHADASNPQYARGGSHPLRVRVGKNEGTAQYYPRKKARESVMYTLALEGFENSKRLVAYRYSLVPNPDISPSEVSSLRIPASGNTFLAASNPTPSVSLSMIKIEAVHLGRQFVGNADDIASEVFWNQADLRKEVRYLPLDYTPFEYTDSSGSLVSGAGRTLYRQAFGGNGLEITGEGQRVWVRYDQGRQGYLVRLFTADERP